MIFRILAALLLMLSLSCGHKSAPIAKSPIEQQHSNTHKLVIYNIHSEKGFKEEAGHCSATQVGPHALLTAQHCFLDSNLIRLDNEKDPTVILAALIDGNDHVIYLVDRTFTHWAGINERQLMTNEPVHFWGSPGDNSDVYRVGYFQKYATFKDVDDLEKFQFQFFILPVFKGDSGSGIFDEAGSVVAVVSMADESSDSFDLPLAFTQKQLNIAAEIPSKK